MKHRRWMERDARQLCDEPAALVYCTVVMPAQETAQHPANNRCDEPVALLVANDHAHCFVLVENAVDCNKTLRTNDHLRVRGGLYVTKPVGGETKGTHHGRFRAFFPILQDLQDGVAAQASSTPDMDEQQEPVSKQPSALPAVQTHRKPK